MSVLVESKTTPLTRTPTRAGARADRGGADLQRARQRAAAGRPACSAPWTAVDWEVIFVDDNSPDGTAAAVRALGDADARVRCIRRIGRRGLAGACIEGMLASQARYVAVMDADLQHDETLLPPC